jgi:hypothetical protein
MQNKKSRTRNTKRGTRNAEHVRIFVLGLFSVPLHKIVLRQVKKLELVKEERMREIFYDI